MKDPEYYGSCHKDSRHALKEPQFMETAVFAQSSICPDLPRAPGVFFGFNLLYLSASKVVNESHGKKSDESHFHVLVVSEALLSAWKSKIDNPNPVFCWCASVVM